MDKEIEEIYYGEIRILIVKDSIGDELIIQVEPDDNHFFGCRGKDRDQLLLKAGYYIAVYRMNK